MSSNGHGPSPAPQEAASASAPDGEKPAAEVFDHDHWHGIVSGYVERAHADKTHLSAMFVDIDALKAANDEVGHDAGNRLIDTVNRVITESVRNENNPDYPDRELDVVTSHETHLRDLGDAVPGVETPEAQAARIGGDEFGILLPDTDREGANALAERLRKAVAKELGLPENEDLAKVGVGISIGVATLEPGMEASDLLRIADKAMYANKLEQLRKLSPEEEASFMQAVEHLEAAGVRPRDVPKYIQLLGASAVTHAIQERDELVAAGQLTLDMPETPQADS